MTGNERDRMWMAYLDGELSPAEASAFDETLTAEERERLAAEMRFESALSEALRDNVKCPDDVWRRTELLVRNAGSARRRRRRLGWGGLIAVAAAAVVVFATVTPNAGQQGRTSRSRVLAALPLSMEEFAARSEVPATPEAVEGYLAEHGVDLRLAKLDSALTDPQGHMHGSISLVGACEGDCPHHTMQALMFNCCGRPVRLLVAPLGSSGAHMLQVANENHEIQRLAVVGDYLAAVAGDHPAPGLLKLLQEPSKQVV